MEPGGVEPPSKLAAKMLSTRLVSVCLSARGRYGTNQPCAYLLNFAHASKPALAIHSFMILLAGRRTAGLPGKHPVPRTLSGFRDSPRLGSESIVVAIYWLRELVFNGTVSQPPTCLQIHIHAVKTKRPQWIYLFFFDLARSLQDDPVGLCIRHHRDPLADESRILCRISYFDDIRLAGHQRLA